MHESEPVKRETGENPVRTRHCEQGISGSEKCHWITGRQISDVKICESGDLPGVYMEEIPDHEELVVQKWKKIIKIIRPFYTLLRMISWKGFCIKDDRKS